MEQFCDLMVIILLIAAGISMVSGNVESTIVIVAVLIMNAILGTVQNKKAEKSLESLKSRVFPQRQGYPRGQKDRDSVQRSGSRRFASFGSRRSGGG